jgi:putative two-component system response regulator
MAHYSRLIGESLGLPVADQDLILQAAPMHDVGKIGIPDHILLKKGKLTDDEFDVMRRHTQIGAAILAHSVIPLLSMGKTIALQHHERWDGTGYPHGHTAADTEECARIVAIADVYDALVTDRVYRPAFSETEALSIMRSSNGTHFDPRLFECFMDTYPDIRRIRFEFPDDTPRQRMLMGN